MIAGLQYRLAALTRRVVAEPLLGVVARRQDAQKPPLSDPASIFVLRNNDLGDVLIITPLFEALRRCFPDARIVAGVGHWSVELLKGNPHLSDVMVVNAPWFNKTVRPQGLRAELAYLRGSDVAHLKAQRFDVGIDVLGSVPGAALLLRAGIPHRLGVDGYAGGHSASHLSVRFNPHEHVGRSALKFAELLGLPASELPENRPQMFLDAHERAGGEARWRPRTGGRLRVVIGPGTGDPPKGWPAEHFIEAARLLATTGNAEVVVVGGPNDRSVGDAMAAAGRPDVTSLAGLCTLRETCAVVAAADAVLSNSSMLMHVAAAFRLPTTVVLGAAYSSASQHNAQWGYPDTCRTLGPEPDRRALATPAEAITSLLAVGR